MGLEAETFNCVTGIVDEDVDSHSANRARTALQH